MKSQNPFDSLEAKLTEIQKALEELKAGKPVEKESVDLIRYIPVPEILARKICSRSTLYAHAKEGHFILYKFGNLTYVDREEFEKAFRPVVLKKVA